MGQSPPAPRWGGQVGGAGSPADSRLLCLSLVIVVHGNIKICIIRAQGGGAVTRGCKIVCSGAKCSVIVGWSFKHLQLITIRIIFALTIGLSLLNHDHKNNYFDSFFSITRYSVTYGVDKGLEEANPK